MGLEPTNLLTASQALYQLSYAPGVDAYVIRRPGILGTPIDLASPAPTLPAGPTAARPGPNG